MPQMNQAHLAPGALKPAPQRPASLSRLTTTFCPRIIVPRRARMTDSAIFSGTSTSENRSAIWIEPTSRGLTLASLTMAPTRSPGRTPAARPAPTKILAELPDSPPPDLYFFPGFAERGGGGGSGGQPA